VPPCIWTFLSSLGNNEFLNTLLTSGGKALTAQTKLGGYSLVTVDRAFDRAGIALALA